jgi:hypothetical protein
MTLKEFKTRIRIEQISKCFWKVHLLDKNGLVIHTIGTENDAVVMRATTDILKPKTRLLGYTQKGAYEELYFQLRVS